MEIVLKKIDFADLALSLSDIAKMDETLWLASVTRRLYCGHEFRQYASEFLSRPLKSQEIANSVTGLNNILPVPEGNRIQEIKEGQDGFEVFKGPLTNRFEGFVSKEQISVSERKLRDSKLYPLMPEELKAGREYIGEDVHFHSAMGVLDYMIRDFTQTALRHCYPVLKGGNIDPNYFNDCSNIVRNATANSILHDLSPFLAYLIKRDGLHASQMQPEEFRQSLVNVFRRDVFRSITSDSEHKKVVCPFSSVLAGILSLRRDDSSQTLAFVDGELGDFFKYLYERSQIEMKPADLDHIQSVNHLD
jgi:hypothetical protein